MMEIPVFNKMKADHRSSWQRGSIWINISSFSYCLFEVHITCRYVLSLKCDLKLQLLKKPNGKLHFFCSGLSADLLNISMNNKDSRRLNKSYFRHYQIVYLIPGFPMVLGLNFHLHQKYYHQCLGIFNVKATFFTT